MNDFIELQIVEAVKKLLAGRVNDILKDAQFPIPIIEFDGNGCGFASVPVIALTACERTEKERIVRLDAYSLTITFSFIEQVECELHCYAYSGAVSRAFYDDPTLGGIVDRAIITGKKYVSPKKLHCGEGYALVVSLRVTVEGIKE